MKRRGFLGLMAAAPVAAAAATNYRPEPEEELLEHHVAAGPWLLFPGIPQGMTICVLDHFTQFNPHRPGTVLGDCVQTLPEPTDVRIELSDFSKPVTVTAMSLSHKYWAREDMAITPGLVVRVPTIVNDLYFG